MLIIIVLACMLVRHASCATETVHVLVSSSNPCPGARCMTLDQFAANPGHTAGSNLTVVFENGTHMLSSLWTLSNLHNLTLMTTTEATIHCRSGSLHVVSFSLIDHTMISGVTFQSCPGTFADTGITATFSNVRFMGGYFKRIRSLADSVRFIGIHTSSGYSFQIYNVSKMVVSNSTFDRGYGHFYITDAGEISTLDITDSNFYGSHADRDPAISYRVSQQTSSMYVSRCNFTNNLRAIQCAGHLTLENSSFSNNRLGTVNARYANITNCHFFQNNAEREGAGAVWIDSTGHGTITDTIFDSNSARFGGAIVAPILTATRCTFMSNTADLRGGVYSHYGAPRSITFIECSFINNTARTESGGVAKFISYHPGFPGYVTFINSDFSYNSAPSCSVLHVSDIYTDHVNITGCTFTHNRATTALEGGGVGCIRNASVSIESSEFSHNTAAVHAGVLNLEQCNTTVTDSTFFNNSATYDGGVFYTLVHTSSYNIFQSTFSHNTAGDDGGVIYLGQSGNLAIIAASNFTSNSAADRGGVITLIASTVYLFQSNVIDNTANKGPLISACNGAVTVPEEGVWNATDPDESSCVLYDGHIDNYNIESISPSSPSEQLSRLISPPDDILSETVYIIVSPASFCLGEYSGVPCYTLEQFAINLERRVSQNNKRNVTLIFESGTHSLISPQWTLSNLQQLTIDSTNVTIHCRSGNLHIIRFSLIDHIMISGVTFQSCPGTFADTGITATFSNARFIGGYFKHIRSLADTVHFTGIHTSSGYSFQIQNVSKMVVSNSTFDRGYGHFYITDAGEISTLNITDSNFYGSHADRDPAISYRVSQQTSSMYVSRCNFTNNLRAIHCAGHLTLENSSFSNNRLGTVNARYANITNCHFFQNNAEREGAGAVWIDSTGYGTIKDTIFDSNSARFGGAIVAPILTATRCTFMRNTADLRGGVYSHYGAPRSITFIECSFINNTARTESGGVAKFISYHSGYPGYVTFINSNFSYNSAPSCSVLHVSEVYTDHVNITGCTFTHNRATTTTLEGGGVACIRNASVSIKSSEFSHNTAATHAGVFKVEECNVTVEQSIFSSNSAAGNGGVMYNSEYSTNYKLQRSVFSHNSAGGDGGVLFVGHAASAVTFSNSNFSNNDATNRGGVISLAGSSLHINETNIYNNTANVGETISACSSAVTIYDDVSSNMDPNAPTCTLYDIHIDSYDVTILDEVYTTAPPTTTEEITTTQAPTTTEEITTTEAPTTTEEITTTQAPTTTEEIMTTEAPTTTEETTTTEPPTTTGEITTTHTTEEITTTQAPTTTEEITTELPTTIEEIIITQAPTTTEETTTQSPTTTTEEITTEAPTYHTETESSTKLLNFIINLEFNSEICMISL